MSKIILLYNNSSLFVEGIRKILHQTSELSLDNHRLCGKELYTLLETDCPDAIILGIQLIGKSGFSILHYLKDHFSTIPILIITRYILPLLPYDGYELGYGELYRRHVYSDPSVYYRQK